MDFNRYTHMYSVTHVNIRNTESRLYSYCEKNAILSWHLYNAALFRIRQCFTGYEKEYRSDNESAVFSEIALLEKEYPSVHVRKAISYSHLEKLMRVTHNPDFFAGLPMQTAQQVIKQAVSDFKNWLASLRKFKSNPDGYTGRPKMPGYKKSMCTFTITNQDAVIYGNSLKLPRIKDRVTLISIPEGSELAEVKVIPYYGRFILSVTLKTDAEISCSQGTNMAGIDFGTDNFAAIAATDGSSRIYKGGAVLSENQKFSKLRAEAVGIITKGQTHMHAASRRLDNLSYHHFNFTLDQMHKISRDIVSFCLAHSVGTLVLGSNRNWKQDSNLGHVNNLSFVQMPIYRLKKLIEYKAAMAGITVIDQEESYTSKASFIDGDYIPTYGADDEKASFTGRRIKRGLYKTKNGRIVNADLNAAANILRKAFPNAWDGLNDYGFLSNPEVSGFHELNPQRIPVKRIAAV